ncbi:hypothetical protein A6R68_17891, partial [Neotoma lepida]
LTPIAKMIAIASALRPFDLSQGMKINQKQSRVQSLVLSWVLTTPVRKLWRADKPRKHFFDLGYDDSEIRKDTKNILFKIVHDPNGGALVETREKFCSLGHTETFMWMRMKETAEKHGLNMKLPQTQFEGIAICITKRTIVYTRKLYKMQKSARVTQESDPCWWHGPDGQGSAGSARSFWLSPNYIDISANVIVHVSAKYNVYETRVEELKDQLPVDECKKLRDSQEGKAPSFLDSERENTKEGITFPSILVLLKWHMQRQHLRRMLWRFWHWGTEGGPKKEK